MHKRTLITLLPALLCSLSFAASAQKLTMNVTQTVVEVQEGDAYAEHPPSADFPAGSGSILQCTANQHAVRQVGYTETFKEKLTIDQKTMSVSGGGSESKIDRSPTTTFYETSTFSWRANYLYDYRDTKYPTGRFEGFIDEVITRSWSIDERESVCVIRWSILTSYITKSAPTVPPQNPARKKRKNTVLQTSGDLSNDIIVMYDDPSNDGRASGGGVKIINANSQDVLFSDSKLGPIVRTGIDYDNDGHQDLLIGTPENDDSSKRLKNNGSVTIVYGPDYKRRTHFSGYQAGANWGAQIEITDLDNDGVSEIIVSAPGQHNPDKKMKKTGAIFIYNNSMTEIKVHYGKTSNEKLGSSMAVANVNSLLHRDIITGAPGANHPTQKLKAVGKVIVYVSTTDTVSMEHFGDVKAGALGSAVAAGDINNDGLDDVVAGSPIAANDKLKGAGSVSVFFANDARPPVTKYGQTAKAELGRSVAAADINGDGYADIIAGAPNDDQLKPIKLIDAGSVSVWSGSGTDYPLFESTPLYGTASKMYFGSSVTSADIDGDSKGDLLIGIRGIGNGIFTSVLGASL